MSITALNHTIHIDDNPPLVGSAPVLLSTFRQQAHDLQQSIVHLSLSLVCIEQRQPSPSLERDASLLKRAFDLQKHLGQTEDKIMDEFGHTKSRIETEVNKLVQPLHDDLETIKEYILKPYKQIDSSPFSLR